MKRWRTPVNLVWVKILQKILELTVIVDKLSNFFWNFYYAEKNWLDDQANQEFNEFWKPDLLFISYFSLFELRYVFAWNIFNLLLDKNSITLNVDINTHII